MAEYGVITGSSGLRHLGKPALSVAAVRAALANYDSHKPGLPPHDESQVVVMLGTVYAEDGHPYVGWYVEIDQRPRMAAV